MHPKGKPWLIVAVCLFAIHYRPKILMDIQLKPHCSNLLADERMMKYIYTNSCDSLHLNRFSFTYITNR